MRVGSLEAYNVASDILDIWKQKIGPELLPVQERAVKEFGLFGDGNLVVFAPTSSGKTFIGEMAAVRAARAQSKVFYLVPMKALAEEKYDELRARYASADIKVVISTRDRREHDQDIDRGDFQIAVVVFEKLQALLVSRPDLLPKVGLVVVDELQIITDEARGPTLELLLTKILSARPRPRIVGLSAVLGRAQLLADWLGAKLLVDTRRPVELRKGVLCKGVFTYREHNSGAQGTEAFSDSGSDKRHEILLAAAEDLVGRGEQVLVFLPDRASTVAYAQVLAERVRQPAVTSAIEELREQEDTHAREALVQVLGSSVAFHNSDLSRDERELVERHFRGGGVRALFSTSTLAMGMNLPVRNVLMDQQKWKLMRPYGRWSRQDLTKSEYENMSGRAGRLSSGAEYGRSILVTYSRFEVDVWLRHYVDRDFEDIVPTLKDAPLEDHVLNLLASHLASSRDGLAELLLASYTGFAYWNQKMSRDEFVAALDAAIARCVAGGMVREAEGKLLPTDVGRAGASKGLGVATTAALAAWAREAKKARHSDLEVLAVLSLSPAASDIHVSLSTDERFAANYRARLLERAAREGCADRPVFERLRDDPYATEYEVARSLKKALLLADWIDEVRAKDIERTYRVWAGTIGRIGEEYSWLVDALAAIAGALDWPDDGRRALSTLADRLVHGIRADAAGLSRVRVRGLGRVYLRRLVTAGLAGEEALAGKTQDELRVVIGNRRVAAALWERLHMPSSAPPYAEAGEETHVLRAAEPAPPGYGAAAAEPPVLRVDLGARTVEYRGVPLPRKPPGNLQPMVFRAFAVLAQHAGEVIGMARLAEEMLALGDLARRPMAPEQRELRYRIVRALRTATKGRVTAAEIEELIESVPKMGLRLRAPGRVEVVSVDASEQPARRAS